MKQNDFRQKIDPSKGTVLKQMAHPSEYVAKWNQLGKIYGTAELHSNAQMWEGQGGKHKNASRMQENGHHLAV